MRWTRVDPLIGRALALVCLAALIGGGTAAAQQPAAKPAPAAAPAAKTAPTASHLAAARELVVASGISRSFSVVIPQLMDQLGTSLTQTRPDLIRDLNVVLVQLQPEFEKQTDTMIDNSARIYADLMTEQEIKAAVAFFTSEAGRKYVNAEPPFMSTMLAQMQSWQQQVSSLMVQRVRAEMRKKGHEM